MKKVAAILCLAMWALTAFTQGTINFQNIPTALISTNAVAIGGTLGNTAPSSSGSLYYYALFTANSSVTTIDYSLQGLLTTTWTFTGLYATNTAGTGGGLFSGGSDVATLQGWPAGVTNSFIVIGWSANLGHDWSTVAVELKGAERSAGQWVFATGAQDIYEFLGNSFIGQGAAGGGTSGNPAFSLWSGLPNSPGDPLTRGFTLDIDIYNYVGPEPSTFALAVLGGSTLLILRRRRNWRA